MSIELVMLSVSSSVTPFFSFPQSFSASGSFPMSQFFASCGQRIGASASASVLPMNTKGWFPLRLTGLISLQAKGLSRVFSNTTVQKHQFFGTQPFLQSNSHIHTWLLEKPQPWLDGPLLAMSLLWEVDILFFSDFQLIGWGLPTVWRALRLLRVYQSHPTAPARLTLRFNHHRR